MLNIEFSVRGEKLAVSYDNVRSSKDYEERLDKEGSYVSVFSNRDTYKANKNKAEKALYINIADIKCPSIYESYDSDVIALRACCAPPPFR